MSEQGPAIPLQKENVYAVPILHHNLETAAALHQVFYTFKPDCVAVELPETMEPFFLQAASRLPDISVLKAQKEGFPAKFFLCEPCEPTLEGLRLAKENGLAAFCIDIDVEGYPDHFDWVPDPYAIERIGLASYFQVFRSSNGRLRKTSLDEARELHMAKRLKELSLSYERVLFVCGMAHVETVLGFIDRRAFEERKSESKSVCSLSTLTEQSCREVMGECGWVTLHFEKWRENSSWNAPPDRQRLIFELYKAASVEYQERTGNAFPGYHLRNLMKFARNYALLKNRLMPDLYQMLSAAKGCVDHHFAYHAWELATSYPYLKNIDNLPEETFSAEEIWGSHKKIDFHLKLPSRKKVDFQKRLQKQHLEQQFRPPSRFTLCSYPIEDVVIEKFGSHLKNRAKQKMMEEHCRVVPFTSSLEEGIDTRETIRHWMEKKLYVRQQTRPPSNLGAVVVVFDEDAGGEGKNEKEKYPWKMTWIGEHAQESDMAFYSTFYTDRVVGPGISRCEYGGFMLSYPPRRLSHIWVDQDYAECRTKSEVLLMAAIDYSLEPSVVYVAAKPPRSYMKSFASRFGKKIVYIPIGQFSPLTLNKLRIFHVLDGYDKRLIADEYID